MSKLLREEDKTILESTGIGVTTDSTVITNNSISKFAVAAVIVDTTPSAFTFVDADVTVAADTIAEATHGMETGLKVQLTTTGTLPAGLALATNYYVIDVSAGTFSLATTSANAVAGTAVDITAAAGGGTHTVTATALDATIDIRASVDGTTYIVVANSSKAFTASTNEMWNQTGLAWKSFKVTLTITAGQVSVTEKIIAWRE